MNRKIRLLVCSLILVLSFGIMPIAAEYDPFEGQINVKEHLVNLIYEDGEVAGIKMTAPSVGQWSTFLSEENQNWSAHSDDQLVNEVTGGNFFRVAPYTYYGSSIWYTDGSKEISYEREFTYDQLHQKEIDSGKRIDQVQTYFGPKSKLTLNIYLVGLDGEDTLLTSDVSYGMFDTEYMQEFKVTGEAYDIEDFMSMFIPVTPNVSLVYDYLEEDQVVDIRIRLPRVTLKFVDEKGNKIRNDEMKEIMVDEAFTFTAPTIDGYTIVSSKNIEEVYTAVDKEFIFIYKQDAIDPVEPVKPVEPTKPTEVVKPSEPTPTVETLPNTGRDNNLVNVGILLVAVGFAVLYFRKKSINNN